MYYFDLYDSAVLGNHREVLIRLTQVLGTVYCLLLVLYYIYPPLELGVRNFRDGVGSGQHVPVFLAEAFLEN